LRLPHQRADWTKQNAQAWWMFAGGNNWNINSFGNTRLLDLCERIKAEPTAGNVEVARLKIYSGLSRMWTIQVV
jgi:hypothetical protein